MGNGHTSRLKNAPPNFPFSQYSGIILWPIGRPGLKKHLSLTVNGEAVQVVVEPSLTLLDLLRDQLGLTGTHEGCDTGACGACTVIVDGTAVLSCMTLAMRCQNKHITTIEGLAHDGKLDPLQQAAIEHDAVQCGFCTAGWLLSARALLDDHPHPTRDEVRTAIAGNLCRCASYQRIEEAILAAAES
jgi:carbon-monoxide dehydrogenase small subunit